MPRLTTRRMLALLVAIITLVLVQYPIESLSEQLPSTPAPTQGVLAAHDQAYMVTKVVDGDTITVTRNGVKQTVRLIGINTPETVDPRKPVECFGKEASAKMKELVSGKQVELVIDPTQQERDKYGRLLRYVVLEDKTFINEYMISEGYAYEYTYDVPYQYQAAFKTAQSEAQQQQKGLWAPDGCPRQ